MSQPSWWQQAGDSLGFPGVAGLGYTGARYGLPALARYGLGAGASLAAAPVAAGMTAASVMQPTPANAGEQPLYVKDARGNLVPNTANPTVRAMLARNPGSAMPWQMGGQAPVSPMPATSPFPTQQNGMNPQTPSPMAQAMSAGPPAPPPQAAAPPTTASVPMPQQRPPMMNVPMPMARPSPSMAPLPLNANPASYTQPPTNLYNGPGSQNFGMGGVDGVTPQQQQTGLFPKLFNDVSKLKQMFGGGANTTAAADKFASANPMLLGSLF
jgi:hypothetical protein